MITAGVQWWAAGWFSIMVFLGLPIRYSATFLRAQQCMLLMKTGICSLELNAWEFHLAAAPAEVLSSVV